MMQGETNKRSMNWGPTFELSEKALEEFHKCVGGPEVKKQNLFGFLLGTCLGSAIPILAKPFKKISLVFPVFGGIYGFMISNYLSNKECLLQALQTENDSSKFVVMSREHNSSQLEKPFELKRGSQMDIETFQQIDQQEDFSSINAGEYQPNANVDGPEKKMSKGITYDELRQKNRDSYRPGQIKLIRQRVQRSVDSSENQSSQSQDFKSGFNEESDLFPLTSDTGKNKTKYGDIWD
ncbi:hypothetical protein M0804_004599 [Polistes exclamans]|nr:hypothetical protein M0804_004599 [Polistes exclamans]